MLVLDTHFVLWLALEPERVPKSFLPALIAARAAGGLFIAGHTLWEIALLVARGRVRLDIPLSVFLDRVESAYHVLPLTAHIVLQGVSFSSQFPDDPADRQIAATAVIHGATLVTMDAKIRTSGEVPILKP